MEEKVKTLFMTLTIKETIYFQAKATSQSTQEIKL